MSPNIPTDDSAAPAPAPAPAPEPILPRRPLLRKLLEVVIAAALAYLGIKVGIDTNPVPLNIQVVGPAGEPLVIQVSSPK
jgi:hypothetical protein